MASNSLSRRFSKGDFMPGMVKNLKRLQTTVKAEADADAEAKFEADDPSKFDSPEKPFDPSQDEEE